MSKDPFALSSTAATHVIFYELRRSPGPFWRLTGEMLRKEGDDEWAERLESVIKKLSSLVYSDLRRVYRSSWSNLAELATVLVQFP